MDKADKEEDAELHIDTFYYHPCHSRATAILIYKYGHIISYKNYLTHAKS
jgi:hypothetical protein